MLRTLLTGLPVILLCLLLQAVLVAKCARYYAGFRHARQQTESQLRDIFMLSAVMLVTLVGNCAQMMVWAVLFIVLGEFGDFPTALYHSGVNFATLARTCTSSAASSARECRTLPGGLACGGIPRHPRPVLHLGWRVQRLIRRGPARCTMIGARAGSRMPWRNAAYSPGNTTLASRTNKARSLSQKSPPRMNRDNKSNRSPIAARAWG